MLHTQSNHGWFDSVRPFFGAIGIAILIIAIITVSIVTFFMRGRSIMEEQLKDKLRSTAAAAAMQFDGDVIERIHGGDTIESSKDLRETVERLNGLRQAITHAEHVYIMRQTDDPALLEFVADADQNLKDEELDLDKNGLVDNNEIASLPGDLYAWAEFPVLGTEAFLHPAVDEAIGTDQWGASISGYAPIKKNNGQIVATLGIDMSADEYLRLTTSIFSPIGLLLFALASSTIICAITLILWRRRVEIINRLEIERNGLLRLAFHQLGGPLTIINWSLEELEEDGPVSIQRTILNIHEGVTRLSQILAMLKSADLVHAGKIEYKREFASLTSILEDVTKESAARIALRKQRVVLDLEENITMNIDAKLIAGVVRELITNAVDFSPDNATITVRSRKIGNFAEFSVIDHGCGIPKKDMRRIFDEFSRGSNATKYKADGNGLGLYIVRGVIEQAGGTVSVQSEERKGTTVTVRLPIA